MTANDRTTDPLAAVAFRGKTALVLGASRGIGAATAQRWAAHGARVVLAARSAADLEAVRARITADGGEAVVRTVDLGEAEPMARLREFLERSGGLDFAFNNAGESFRPCPLADIPPDEFERALRVGVLGMFRALQLEIPLLLAKGGGAIVNMASTAGVSAFGGGGAYVTAKHAILGLTKSAALDYAERGIRVNAVAPGPIETDRLRAAPEAERDRTRMAVPMRALGRPTDVADAVLWLCSEASRFVTGATLFVDGGRSAGFA